MYDAVLYFCIVFTLRFVSTLSVSLRSISYRMAGIVQAEWLGLIGLVTVSLVEIFNCIVVRTTHASQDAKTLGDI